MQHKVFIPRLDRRIQTVPGRTSDVLRHLPGCFFRAAVGADARPRRQRLHCLRRIRGQRGIFPIDGLSIKALRLFQLRQQGNFTEPALDLVSFSMGQLLMNVICLRT